MKISKWLLLLTATILMGEQVANMSRLDFLLLLWEARIVGEDYVEANS